jgi:DNA (cytosine-5)-methyltransferase 1
VALFGEQVDDAVGFGWFDRVRIDLESHGYSVAPPLVVPACSVGAPHRRDRLWFIADNVEHAARERRGEGRPQHELRGRWDAAPGAGGAGDMEHADQRRGERRQFMWSGRDQETSLVVGADGKARRVEPGICLLAHGIPARIPKLRALGNAIVPQLAAEIIGAYLDTED